MDCGFVRYILLCAFCVVTDSFFFSLCGRIFNCRLRSFALARATSPCQSQRAGPQRFLVWVRVWRCCALEMHQVITAEASLFTNHYSLSTVSCPVYSYTAPLSAAMSPLRPLLSQADQTISGTLPRHLSSAPRNTPSQVSRGYP